MSKHRYYWYAHVKNCIRRYPAALEAEDSIQATIAAAAIKQSLAETAALEDGYFRVRLIQSVYMKKTSGFRLACLDNHVSERTAQRWVQDFIYLTAAKMGYTVK